MPTQEERITSLEQTTQEYRPVLQNFAYELSMVKGLIITQTGITQELRHEMTDVRKQFIVRCLFLCSILTSMFTSETFYKSLQPFILIAFQLASKERNLKRKPFKNRGSLLYAQNGENGNCLPDLEN